MKRRMFGICCGVILSCALVAVAPSAKADERNQATQFTFNQPVAIPGNEVLPAGTYWFVLPDQIMAPNLVQVFNADHTQLLASFMVIPAARATRTDDSQLTFAQRSKNQPIAIQDWFYPGQLSGHQFLYSPQMEARLSEDPQVTVIAHPAPQPYAG